MLKRLGSRLVSALKPRNMLEAMTTTEAGKQGGEDDKTAMKRQRCDDDDGGGNNNNNNSSSSTPAKIAKCDSNPPPRADRKRKVALLMAYSGEGYYGIQVNTSFPTIESELFKALVAVGLVPQDHVNNPYKMSFQRAARTDKGVSAVGQVVSLKMLLNVDDVIGQLNSKLPDQIRILGLLRTTNSFNSKNHCSHRTYIYVMPTFALTPVEENVALDYRIHESKLTELNQVLALFKGTHNFHNFTSGRKHSDPSAKRYIMEFKAGQPVVIDGLELVTIQIQGQSFMLHHIRKMIGLSIAIVRGFCGRDVIDLAWRPEKVDIPKAPGLGLVLERLHYNGYNKRFGDDGVHEPLVWGKYEDQMEKFKEEFIMKNIVEKEKEEKSMLSWLLTLHNHTFGYVSDEGERTPTPVCRASMKVREDDRHANSVLRGNNTTTTADTTTEDTDTTTNTTTADTTTTTTTEDSTTEGTTTTTSANTTTKDDATTTTTDTEATVPTTTSIIDNTTTTANIDTTTTTVSNTTTMDTTTTTNDNVEKVSEMNQ